ncbi:glycyl-tRNA synthetase (class II) [Nitrobacteraceae bacterium AZCC 2161]
MSTVPATADTTIPVGVTRQAIEADGRSGRLKVTGKLKVALDLMVWSGKRRAEAAEEAGLADSSLRFALRKPHVLAHYNGELAALRTSLRARNVHRLDGIADSSGNDMARVSAIKAMETLADQADAVAKPSQQQVPGMIIVINNGGSMPKVIDQPLRTSTIDAA